MKKILIILLVVLVAGCAKKYTRSAEEDTTDSPRGSWEVVKEEREAPDTAYAKEEGISERELSIAEMAKTVLMDVLFDYDKYNIRPESRPALDAAAAFMNENMDLNIVIEGHCDERGTNEYNLALGEKRAKSTKTYLVSLGVAASRIITITYGEEKPTCTMSSESCWQRNRRAHFVVVGKRN
jgi:peptidoglycan-associated lipoprotein